MDAGLTHASTSANAVAASGVSFRTFRTEAELLLVRDAWRAWQQHPQTDYEFFQTLVKTRPEVISPYVIGLYRDGALETLLVGRYEKSDVVFTFGYWRLMRFP